MHILFVAAADGPSSSCPPHQYQLEFVSRWFMGYDRIEVSNGSNYTNTERLIYTAVTNYLLIVQYLRSPSLSTPGFTLVLLVVPEVILTLRS